MNNKTTLKNILVELDMEHTQRAKEELIQVETDSDAVVEVQPVSLPEQSTFDTTGLLVVGSLVFVGLISLLVIARKFNS